MLLCNLQDKKMTLVKNMYYKSLFSNKARHTSSIKRRAIIGGAAYPNPSTMASNDRSNPPLQSIPEMEHINRPAKAIAPYIPKVQKAGESYIRKY